ncbi:hypothetical protein [Kineosporia sp. NBRC 101731]|uniref:hypothetical protein n=1 Tax=Kineosporia sp. NBRC 101731 TaxID=3032199 RepID=UPI002555F5F3|nr:hypothetical protein [Kineosporia sp. NBRC 101731]
MHEKGIADPAGFVLTLLGISLVFLGSVVVLLSVDRQTRKRQAAALVSKVPNDLGQRRALLAALGSGTAPERLTELRLYATALRSRRWMVLLQTGVLMGSWGSFLQTPSGGQVSVAGLVTVIYLPLLVFSERNARVADTFLRRYPEGEPMGDEATGDRGPVA